MNSDTPSPRTESQLVRAAADWCREVRVHFGWSEADLIERCRQVQQPFRYANGMPSIADISDLESGRLKQLPRWLRFARYAVEKEQLPLSQRAAWPGARTWFTPTYTDGDPFDCSYPLVFRDEFYFLEDLNAFPESERRSIRRFIAARQSPYSTIKEASVRFLRDMGVELEQPPEADGLSDLNELYRALTPTQQKQVLALTRDTKQLGALEALSRAQRIDDAHGTAAALSRLDSKNLVPEYAGTDVQVIVGALRLLSPDQRGTIGAVVEVLLEQGSGQGH